MSFSIKRFSSLFFAVVLLLLGSGLMPSVARWFTPAVYAVPTNVTYYFEDITHNGTSFTSSSQTFTLTGNMVGQKATSYGSNLSGQTGNSDGYMDSGATQSRSGNVGGIAAPAGYTFRALLFDVWPSQNGGNNVLSPPQSITVIGKRNGSQVVSVTVSSADYGQNPVAQGGAWQRINLSSTSFATTDIDTVEFVLNSPHNYLAVDNFVYSTLGLASPTATATATATNTSLPTATNTATPTATATNTPAPTATNTATATNTPVPTATNSVPTFTNLDGDSVVWADVGNTARVDQDGNATIGDTEFEALNGGNSDWAGATLTVQRASTAWAADLFAFDPTGSSFTIDTDALQVAGQTFATFTNSGGVLTINFTSTITTATTALVQAVLRHITYRNDTPAGDATLRFTLSDGNSNTTADVTVTSDFIYVTNTTDSTTIDLSDGVSFSEAVASAAADQTGTQTLVLSSGLAGGTTLSANRTLTESLIVDADLASGFTLSSNTLTLAAGATITLHIWVVEPEEHRRETVVDYTLGGNPGRIWSRGGRIWSRGGRIWSRGGRLVARDAPIISGDGQVILYTDDLMLDPNEEWFYTIQAATVLPNPPSWTTVVGRGYWLNTSGDETLLQQASLSFNYLGSEVPPGQEQYLHLYFCACINNTDWEALDTTLDTASNIAAALSRGSGLYVLMSSLPVALPNKGLNLFQYPAQVTVPVTQALASIDGKYTTIYHQISDAYDGWKVYDINAPSWVNDLTELEFQQLYWINLTEPVTVEFNSGSLALGQAAMTPSYPPAIYYGTVTPSTDFTPVAGMPVTAWVNDQLCGQGRTLSIEGQIVYKVDVLAGGISDHIDCGALGRTVTLKVDVYPMLPKPIWSNSQVTNLVLSPLQTTGTQQHLIHLPWVTR